MVVPALTPCTMPVAEPTVATDVVLLLHVPPVVPSVNGVVNPIHTMGLPLMGGAISETIALPDMVSVQPPVIVAIMS